MPVKPPFTLAKFNNAPERIAKHIARAGLCSRREAEARILDGRVSVNGEIIAGPALNVTASDSITVDGKLLPQREATRHPCSHRSNRRLQAPRAPRSTLAALEAAEPAPGLLMA